LVQLPSHMPPEDFEELIGHMLTDEATRKGILSGLRARMLQGFNFTHDEVEFLLGVRADSLEAFAAQCNKYLEGQAARKGTERLE